MTSSTHNYTARQLIPRVLRFVRPFRGLLAFSLVANLLFSLFNALTLAIVEPVFRTLFSGQQTASGAMALPPNVTQVGTTLKASFDNFIYGLLISPDFFTTIRNLSIAIFLLFLFRSITKYMSNLISTRLEEGIMKSIRDALFMKLTDLSMEYYGRRKTGEIISLLTNDVGVLNHATINSITALWRELTTIVIYVTLLLIISAKLTAIALVISLLGLVLIRTSTTFLRRYGARMQNAQADYTATLQETVTGIRVIKALTVEPLMIRKFVTQTAHFVRSALKNTRVLSLVPAVNDTFGILALVAVFYAGGAALAGGELTAPNLMTFLFLLFGLMQPISVTISTIAGMQRGIVAASNIVNTLDEEPSVVTGTEQTPPFERTIDIRNVSFAYGTADVLRDVSFSIRRGETVALVGASGSGKSTMLDLLMRFYDPQQGSIDFDGTNVRAFDLASYRRRFGTVSQETILFNDSVANNISLGEPDAERAAVERAAGIAHADTFIKALPEGYDTNIGDRGMKLSGGQRQRVAIARALYRDPDVLLFDEATSALDTESERIVQDAINGVLKNRTAVIVAHRLSTIVHADRILVFDHGRIVEEGSHGQLLERKGVYARLHALQFKESAAAGS